MILAADVGGTKTRLALFAGRDPEPVRVETYPTAGHDGLGALVACFLEAAADLPIEAACFAVAGPVESGVARGVNLPWPVYGHELAEAFGIPAVTVVNDLEANARGIDALGPDQLATINPGRPRPDGNRVVVSAGTGLGQAGLVRTRDGYEAVAGEGGHVDFAPRSEIEIALYRYLAARFGHVSYERICSGAGIVELYRFLGGNGSTPGDAAAVVAEAAAEPLSLGAHALELFSSVYGAQAGNAALTFMATGGVYLGGGIAPRLVDRLAGGSFMTAFVDKGRFSDLLADIPVHVILDDRAALFGAAAIAVDLRTAHRDLEAALP